MRESDVPGKTSSARVLLLLSSFPREETERVLSLFYLSAFSRGQIEMSALFYAIAGGDLGVRNQHEKADSEQQSADFREDGS